MLNRDRPSQDALRAFDREIDGVLGLRPTSTGLPDAAGKRWGPLLEVARLLRAEGARSRRQDPATMARVWDDVYRRTLSLSDDVRTTSSPAAAHPNLRGRILARYTQSFGAGLCLGGLTMAVNHLWGVPVGVAVSPSIGLALTSIGYELAGRTVEFRPATTGLRRR